MASKPKKNTAIEAAKFKVGTRVFIRRGCTIDRAEILSVFVCLDGALRYALETPRGRLRICAEVVMREDQGLPIDGFDDAIGFADAWAEQNDQDEP